MLLFVAALYNYNVLYIAQYTLALSYTVRIYDCTTLSALPYIYTYVYSTAICSPICSVGSGTFDHEGLRQLQNYQYGNTVLTVTSCKDN